MRFVIVESPYAGDVAMNVAYGRAALRDCLDRGEAPFASHLLYAQPGVLNDAMPDDREAGIDAGLEIGKHASATVAYVDFGISPGMQQGLKAAEVAGRSIEYRRLPKFQMPERPPPMLGVLESIGDYGPNRIQGAVLRFEDGSTSFVPADIAALRTCGGLLGDRVLVQIDGVAFLPGGA